MVDEQKAASVSRVLIDAAFYAFPFAGLAAKVLDEAERRTRKKITVDRFLEAVCTHYSLESIQELAGHNRKISEARGVAARLASPFFTITISMIKLRLLYRSEEKTLARCGRNGDL